MHAFPVLYQGIVMADPTYFDQFWTEPGYLGYDPPPSLQRDRVQRECEIAAVIAADEATVLGLLPRAQPGQAQGGVDTAWRGPGALSSLPVAVRLSCTLDVEVEGAEMLVSSGGAEGARLGLLRLIGDIATFGPGDADALRELRPGDVVRIDNSGYLAAQTYHRHQVPESDDFPPWDQFRRADGAPLYPQRPLILGPLFAAAASGTVQSGRFDGRMIVVESLLDREALPWQADWYRSKVQEHLGHAIDDQFRLWFTENALHGDSEAQESRTHTVSYLGVLHQALRDLSRWVEDGVVPAATTTYVVDDGQVIVPPEAAERGGVQPSLSVTVHGGQRADIASGDELTLCAVAEVPKETGVVVGIEWDFDGSGTFAEADTFDPASRVVVERRHSFVAPGTCFPTARVIARRDGKATSPFARLQNLARVRVVVRES
jgi:hypothetical protein